MDRLRTWAEIAVVVLAYQIGKYLGHNSGYEQAEADLEIDEGLDREHETETMPSDHTARRGYFHPGA